MITLTKEQITSLKRIYDRTKLDLTYRKFRESVQGTIGCDGAIVVHWCNMWLCIERDGYTHS